MNKSEAEKEVHELRKQLRRLGEAYYNEAKSLVPDSEYDALMRRLKDLEKEFPKLLTADSPSQVPGATPVGDLPRVAHARPMLSINDVFNYHEVETFIVRLRESRPRMDFSVQPKIDGVAISLIYQEGKLVRAVTRGDGAYGDDVTANALATASIPNTIQVNIKHVEVRGEVFMSSAVFKDLNRQREAEGKPLMANQRNSAAGAIKLKDPQECAKRRLSFTAYAVHGESDDEFRSCTETDIADLACVWGIPYVPTLQAGSAAEVIEALRRLEESRDESSTPLDGAVIKVHQLSLRATLGATSKAPRWACAFKFPASIARTKVRDIVIQVGRTGVLTPVAELDPVQVDGSTVSRATLHNQREIDRKDVRIGDTVVIEKAGDIIPAVVGVDKLQRPADTTPYNMVKYGKGLCEACPGPIYRKEGEVAWRCGHTFCSAQVATRLSHAASRKALDILGLGEVIIQQLVERKKLTKMWELLDLTVEDLSGLELPPAKAREGQTVSNERKLGEARARKIVRAIEQAKELPMSRWLYALGIPGCGNSACQEIERLHPDWQAVVESPVLRALAALEGQKKDHAILSGLDIKPALGPSAAREWVRFRQSPAFEEFDAAVLRHGIRLRSESYGRAGGKLQGKTLVITGTLSRPRSEIQSAIEAAGGKVTAAISANTSYLVCGEGGGSKRSKAEKLLVPVIDEGTLEGML